MSVVQPLDENQGPSKLRGHGHGLVCGVALRHLQPIMVRDDLKHLDDGGEIPKS